MATRAIHSRWAVVPVVLFATGIVLGGCSASGPPNPDEDFAAVLCSHDGSSAAPVNQKIEVEFNDALVASTVDGQSVVLEDADGHAKDCDLLVSGRTLTIVPRSPLHYGMVYTLTLGTDLEGAGLGALPEPVVYGFVTQLQPHVLDIPPFDVVRHGETMNGLWANAEGAIAVGNRSACLLSTDHGRFMLPYPSVEPLAFTDVWVSSAGGAFITGQGQLNAYSDELGWILKMWDRGWDFAFMDDYLPAVAVHGTLLDQVYASAGNQVRQRSTMANWPDIAVNPDGTRDFSDPAIRDVWSHPAGYVYAAGALGIHRGRLISVTLAGWDYEWELARVTPVPCTAISGIAALDVVGISGDSTTWLHGDEADPVRSEGYYWTDIWWADESWAVQIGLDSDYANVSRLFDEPLVDHQGRGAPIDTDEKLNAVKAWTVGLDKYAMVVGDAGVELRFVDKADDPNDGQWSVDTLAKRDAQGEIPGWADLSGSPELMDFALYGLRDGKVVKCNLLSFDWTTLPALSMDLVARQIFCVREDDLWTTAIADGGFDWYTAHYDGDQWSTRWLSSMDVPRDLWAPEGGPLFVACDNGTVYRGGVPMSAVNPAQHLYGIWGSSAKSVWVCGANGTIAHYEEAEDGSWAWTRQDLAGITAANLRAIFGSAESNIVVVGDGGTVLRYDGNTWTDLSPGPEFELQEVDLTMAWTLVANEIWVASPDDVILKHDATGWIRYTTGFRSARLNAMWGGDTFAGGDLWIGGDKDLLLRQADPPAILPLVDRK